MAELKKTENYIHISYDSRDWPIQEETSINTDIFNSATPIELLQAENPKIREATENVNDIGATKVSDEDRIKLPYTSCLKLVSHFASGNTTGSAALLRRPDMMVTAAHCVYNPTNHTYPAYAECYWRANGDIAQDNTLISAIFIPKEYAETGDSAYDYAICVLAKEMGDGYRNALDFNTERTSFDTTTIGYPSIPSDQGNAGKIMYYSKNKAYKDNNLLYVDNGLSYGGASGGPWVFDGKVGGVTSAKWEKTTKVCSPILDNKFAEMYDEAEKHVLIPSVNAFTLQNEYGWYQSNICVLADRQEYKDDYSISINTTREIPLDQLKIPAYSIVKLKVYVWAGEDQFATETFFYDPNKRMGAHYMTKGTTLYHSLTYKNMYPR